MNETKIQSVMLIDDEEIDRKSYERILKKSGIVGDVMSYGYADEALEYLANQAELPVDAILLDINMPRMDGFEFLDAATHRLGEDFAKVIVVMLTTSINPKDQARAENNPLVKDFLNKPLTVDDVFKVAEHVTV